MCLFRVQDDSLSSDLPVRLLDVNDEAEPSVLEDDIFAPATVIVANGIPSNNIETVLDYAIV